MAQTIEADNLDPINVKETSVLDADIAVGASSVALKSAADFNAGDLVYLGLRPSEGCEKLSILSIAGQVVTFSSPAKFKHKRGEDFTSVYCDTVSFMRAPNVTGQPPARNLFTALPSGDVFINADDSVTLYTDPDGSDAYWYLYIFKNSVSGYVTDINAALPMRGQGDSFQRYTSLQEIRIEAGFRNAKYITDVDIEMHRKSAEEEVNSYLSKVTSIPLDLPLPEQVSTITRRLAAGYLLMSEYGPQTDTRAGGKNGQVLIDWATNKLKEIVAGTAPFLGTDGSNLGQYGSYGSAYPDEETEPMFAIDHVY